MTWLVNGDAREYGGISGWVKDPNLDPWMLLKMQVTNQIDFSVQTKIMYFSLNL